MRSEPAISRVPVKGPIVFEARHQGVAVAGRACVRGRTGILVLGAVLDRFLARYASMNSFTQLVLASQTRGVVKTWAPRVGARSVL